MIGWTIVAKYCFLKYCSDGEWHKWKEVYRAIRSWMRDPVKVPWNNCKITKEVFETKLRYEKCTLVSEGLMEDKPTEVPELEARVEFRLTLKGIESFVVNEKIEALLDKTYYVFETDSKTKERKERLPKEEEEEDEEVDWGKRYDEERREEERKQLHGELAEMRQFVRRR